MIFCRWKFEKHRNFAGEIISVIGKHDKKETHEIAEQQEK
jgi:hypothetical protein